MMSRKTVSTVGDSTKRAGGSASASPFANSSLTAIRNSDAWTGGYLYARGIR